jgi:hypothetical protein
MGLNVTENDAKQLALGIALRCVRNTFLEDLHAGTPLSSIAEDYADVKVVAPGGEIEWTRISRLSNDEMRQLMKEVVNKLYSVLLRLNDPVFVESVKQFGKRGTIGWDEPQDVVQPMKARPT